MPPKEQGYVYRTVFPEDQKLVKEYRDKALGVLINSGYDIGTKKAPTGTPEQRKYIADQARVVLECLGLLPADFIPLEQREGDLEERKPCNHVHCEGCGVCRCDGFPVRYKLCENCRWERDEKAGRHG